MRPAIDSTRIREFMHELGRAFAKPACIYFVGGGTAVLNGWRAMTADIDLKFVCEEGLGPVLSNLKSLLNLNIELASPDQFIPSVPGWERRCEFIQRERQIDFFHFDLYSQALSKIERGFDRDLIDVAAMLNSGGVDKVRLLKFFNTIKPELNRYPALDPLSFKQAVIRVATS